MNRAVVVSLALAMTLAGCSKAPKNTRVKAAEQKITATATDARDQVRGAWRKVTGPTSAGMLAQSAPSPEKPSAASVHHGRRRK